MSGEVVKARPPATTQLALAGPVGAKPARDAREAIEQAHDLFAGTYLTRWSAAPTSPMAWLVVLSDATADEIAAATLAHVRDTVKRDDGTLACDWPPTPGSILERIQTVRKAKSSKVEASKDRDDAAVHAITRLANSRASGAFDRMNAADRESLEQWAARGRAVIAARQSKSTVNAMSLIDDVARRCDARGSGALDEREA